MDKNYAYLAVTGQGATSAVTEALGIAPTKHWNLGDLRSNGTVYGFSHWSFQIPEFEKPMLDEAIRVVVDFIESRGLDFEKLPAGFEAIIQCVGYHEEKSPGFHLERNLVQRLGRLGLAIDFDLYCHAKDYGQFQLAARPEG